jgi:hypothetical protein
MNPGRRVAATRLGRLVLSVFLLAMQFPFSASIGIDPDRVDGPRGRPLPRHDAPAAAVAFRQLQWKNERGSYRVNAFVEAKAHADAMRARARARRFPAAGTSLGSGSSLQEVVSGGPGPLLPVAGIDRGNWTWLGPGNIGGRVRSLVIDPTSTNVMFAGGVAGGLFKTTTGGASWSPVDDFMANLAVSTIVMQPGLPTTMYAGTGEGFYNADGIRGAGVFTSADGGVTWSQLPATANANWWYVNRLAISPNGGVMLAATRTGIFRSTNGGASWTNTTPTEMTYAAFHPTDSTRAIASGYAGNAYVSTNGGATWTPATGLPGGPFTRVELAYARGNPTMVYASVDVNGGSIYKSTNGGASFSAVFNGAPDYLGTQGWYGNAIWVDPTNEATLIVGGIDLWKSTDGGASLTQISSWEAAPASPHADQHAIVEQPGFNGASNTTVWFTNDGGVYGTDNVHAVGGGSAPYTSGWNVFNNNLGITQFYGAGGGTSTGVVLGGTQDNGTLKYTPATGTTWSMEFGGDGGASAVDPSNNSNLYGEYTYGAIHRSTDGGTSADWINGLFWDGVHYVCKAAPYTIVDTCNLFRANFIAPLILDPNDSNRLFVGGASLWRTNDATRPNTATTGPTWTSVKEPAGPGNYISAIAVATGDADAIWVGHNSGQLFKTINGTSDAPTWNAVGAGMLPNRFVTRVRVDPTNTNTVYVAYGGFSGSNLWRTTDGGSSWASVSGSGVTGLPAAPVRDLAISVPQPLSLYAATEVGIFTSQDGGATWTVPQDGPANVSVEELFWMGPSLVAVTHGRGLFKTTPGSGRLTPAITWPTPAAITYGTALDAVQLNATANVPGTFVYTPGSGTVLPAGSGRTLSVVFSPTDGATYGTATATVSITVAPATPTIAWSTPAAISYGTPLSGTQLNATASVPGAFVYTPAVGTVLSAGAAQTLSATITPTDTANYIAATRSVAITVEKATPAITWTTPASITYGTALGATQLNATASVAGTFAYSPAAGTVLSAGAAQSLSVTFTPIDGANNATATTSRTITVAKATPAIAWSPPANVPAGTALGPTELNATASVPGTFVYTPAAGTALSAGSNRALQVAFTPADTANYATATMTVLINVMVPAIDAMVWTDRPTAQSTIVSPAFSTTASNELVLALVATDYGSGANTSVTSVTGAGLTWALVGRSNVQAGTSEIWRAFAGAPLTAATVTASLSQPVSSMLTVLSFANVDRSGTNGSGAIGATAAADSSSGAPAATLVTTRNNAWVFGVGNDYDNPIARAVGADQTMVHQYLAPVGDTYWVQRQLAPTALAGTSVTINATAPAGDRYNLFIAEIRPFTGTDTTPPTVSVTAPSDTATVAGTGVTVAAAAGDNVGVAGVQFKVDGVNLGVEDVSSPYTILWDTTKALNGGHLLTAVARDGDGNTATSAAVPVSVQNAVADLTAPIVTLTAPAPGSAVLGPAVTVSANASDNVGVAGVQFLLDGAALGAEIPAAPFTIAWSTTKAPNGVHTLAARARDAAGNVTTSAPVSVTVSNPVSITWNAPADIVYATALGAAQLNATASVPGTFAYMPAAGTVLSAGPGQALSVTFTPTDAVNYTTATAGVTINVGQLTPTITWSTPANITSGTALSAAQLNATAHVPGTLVYTPAAGTVLPAGGGQVLSVMFTPTDAVNYAPATASVAITVGSATPTLAWSAPANITYGTALGPAQLNATASVPGTLVYTPAAGTVLPAGGAQALSVFFTPTDAVNYGTATASVAIAVAKATPAITWSAPVNIVYGSALGAAQLNATASVPGTFVYAPAAGTVLPAGTGQPLVVTFTPTDAANYTTATASRTITVAKATPAITWSAPASIPPGIALSATQLNATASMPGTFVYTPAAGTVLSAGSNQVLQVAFTPADAANYGAAAATVLINVMAPTPTIDALVWTDRPTAQSTVVSPVFSTTAPNELVLAFVATDYGSGANTSVTSVTGAGLTWALIGRTNIQAGTSEIWRAFAAVPLSGVTVTASLSQPVSSMMTVVSFANVETPGTNGSGAIGATAAANSSSGSPTATLVTTRNNSWVFGVGNDYDNPIARTVGPGQILVHQYLAPAGDTYWVQRQLTPTALAGTSVTINATAPAGDRYNLFIAEIRPFTGADTTAPSASMTAPANNATVAGTAVTVSAAASDNVGVAGVQFKLDGVNLGVEDGSSPYTIVWDTTKAANGSHSLTAVARDGAGNSATSGPVTVTVNNAVADLTPPIVTMTAPAPGTTVLGPAVTVSAIASDDVGVAAVQFLLDGAALGTEVTAGPFTRSWSTITAANGLHTLAARARDAAGNVTTSAPVSVTVSNPVTISWSAPAGIVYGTALSATQLNATASVPGTFVYTPAAGTVLNAGAGQTLSARFTPTDTVNYAPATATVAIAVGRATPALTWSAPANITYGTPLSATQLNATASVPGAFVYTPAAGTVLNAGAGQALSVIFTPSDAANYTPTTASVAITVGRATPALTWSAPSNIIYGTGLSATQLNATATVPGTFVYTPAAGTMLQVGAAQALTVMFTPTDAANYTTAASGVTITVLKATPTMDAVVWTDEPAARATISSPAFSTTASNELLLAFIATDYNGGVNTTVTTMTGGGLTWVLVARANAQAGTSEIWRAFAMAPLTGITVTAAMSQPVSSMMTVVSFANIDTSGDNGSGAIGATATASRAFGAPAATLVTSRNNSWVFGVGNDFDKPIARTVGAGQTLVHQYLPPVGDTYWVQRTINPTPLAGTTVTINDTAPTADRSNLTLCEIRPPQ